MESSLKRFLLNNTGRILQTQKKYTFPVLAREKKFPHELSSPIINNPEWEVLSPPIGTVLADPRKSEWHTTGGGNDPPNYL